MAIAFDVGSNSGVQASISSYTFSHTAGSLINGLVGCIVLSRGGASVNTDPNVTACSYNSVALTQAVQKNNADLTANVLVCSIWYGVAPASGAHNFSITFSGTTNTSVAYGFTLSGVDQISPLDNSTSNAVNAQASPVSNNITTIANNAWIVDGIYNKIGTALTRGAGQTLISTETFPSAGGDTADASYKGPITPAASTPMSWSYTGTDDYNQVIASFKPANPTGNFFPFFRP